MALGTWVRMLLGLGAAELSQEDRERARELESNARNAAAVQTVGGSIFVLGAFASLTGHLYASLALTALVNVALPWGVVRAARRVAQTWSGDPLHVAQATYAARLTCLLGIVLPAAWVLKS